MGPEVEEIEGTVRPARRRRRRFLLPLVVLLAVIFAATWIQRRTIARGFIDRELTRRGVPARYTLDQLSPWRQRLTNVVIGDPRRPDLTADWVEVRTAVYPWRAEVLVLRAGQVRMRAHLKDGKLSFGAIDRLLPPPSGKPFALPHVIVEVADAQIALDTPHGPVRLALSGKGMLDDGFDGRLRAEAARLDAGGCVLDALKADVALRVRGRAPQLEGPLRASEIGCGDTRLTGVAIGIDAALGAALDRWKGSAQGSAASGSAPGATTRGIEAQLTFAGDAQGTSGTAKLSADSVRLPQLRANGVRFAGSYVQGRQGFGIRGKVASHAALAEPLLRQVRGHGRTGAGTPVGPLAAKLAAAAARAAASFDARADVALCSTERGLEIAVSDLGATAASGARIAFRGTGIALDAAGRIARLDGTLTTGGGDMPEAELRLVQPRAGAQVRGSGFVRPYAAGDARLALAGIEMRIDPGGTGALRTAAEFSGPLGDGRIERLRMPVALAWSGGSLEVNRACAPAAFDALAIGSLSLPATRMRLCPVGGAMVRIGPGGLGGGVSAHAPRLAGALGSSPFRFAAADARVDLGVGRFALSDAALRLGAERATQLDVAKLDGGFGKAVGGGFAGLSGQIGAVPLHVSDGAGNWRYADGALALEGRAQVSDTADPARFHPLVSDDLAVRFAADAISAKGSLELPGKAKVGNVAIVHDLNGGMGHAVIDVPGIRFVEDGFQPSDLTPLTFGVVADVSGTVSGNARIDWSPGGVSSTGTFDTSDLDLAAAFGPVQGLATKLHFTDLLGMQTAPGQSATTVEINPGVPVENGTIRYQLLDSHRVRIEGARWPFAGGELVLEPTLLDFSEHRERRLTFRVIGADAAKFLQQMDFDNLNATGIFDGTLPMIFDEKGGRIEGGTLAARGGGSIAYIGEVSQRDLGFWGNMAFQALKSLDYRQLTIAMNGPLAGEMVTEIRFEGVSQGKGAKSNFLLRRLAKLPFVFNVRISAPFHQLLDSVQSWYDPSRLIERNLPTLLEEEEKRSQGVPAAPDTPIQQRESEDVR